jgi:hypothetical protein
LFGEESQQPMWLQVRQRRKWTQRPPMATQSLHSAVKSTLVMGWDSRWVQVGTSCSFWLAPPILPRTPKSFHPTPHTEVGAGRRADQEGRAMTENSAPNGSVMVAIRP